MKNLILVAVILQLVITVDSNDFQFGDIIAFKPRCKAGFYYRHFAVYVGEEEFEGKKPGDKIFERLNGFPPKCVFSPLPTDEEPVKANYLDRYKHSKTGQEYQIGNKQEITQRIKERHAKCELYFVGHNNCEHLATYVRYGVKIALQFDLTGESLCANDRVVDKQDIVQFLRSRMTEVCPEDPSHAG